MARADDHVQTRVGHGGCYQPGIQRRGHRIVAPVHDQGAVRNTVATATR
jgi:hypothetical protein